MSIVAVGSYNSFLSGWEFQSNENLELKSKQLFGFKVDKNCIKTVSVSPHYLALGGTDDLIRLYDLTIKREVCTLMDHSGTVNKIVILNEEMISCSDDGNIIFYKLSPKKVDLINKIHVSKDGVIDIALDSTGKICLCIGKKYMKVVDLYRGKVAFETKLTFDPETINWVHNDEFFCISHKNLITVYNRKFEEFKILECDPKQVVRVASSFDNLLMIGTDKGEIITWDFITPEEIKETIEKEEEIINKFNELKENGDSNEKEEEKEEGNDLKEQKSDSDISLNSDDEKVVTANIEEMETIEQTKEKMENEKQEETEKVDEKIKDDNEDNSKEDDIDIEEEEKEQEYPMKQIIQTSEGRIRGVQQIIVGEWVGFAVGYSDGKLLIIDREGNIALEMNTGMRITALGATSF
ncbi:hypothetical protein ENUP19_0161G0060 [Entamoeba nuttalli]|uniref:WD domain, G-beta repeat-containing protein n=2 Tax=Entamoeba nuttalli TaxID=412467 RepID=K2H4P9_ENTNP|nr:WD domain, G-beta repeat-containing protein [Entamoeba nuttalli P19]EKE41312.1 WD domain, G-beta repeat-containing protein [Entamoeba nuttalli P19]|eukprot:XP_008856347.1 WD domain, G-beta repeat-containing protein [Entamoeba nuttalli P19]